MIAKPAHLSALGIVCALGQGKGAVAKGLFSGDTSGLRVEEGWLPHRPARVGRVPGALAEVPASFWKDDSRNSRLLLTALTEIRAEVEEAILRYGRDRVGVVLGTSTSGIEATERAMAHPRDHGTFPPEFHYQQQEVGPFAPFLAECQGQQGPALFDPCPVPPPGHVVPGGGSEPRAGSRSPASAWAARAGAEAPSRSRSSARGRATGTT